VLLPVYGHFSGQIHHVDGLVHGGRPGPALPWGEAPGSTVAMFVAIGLFMIFLSRTSHARDRISPVCQAVIGNVGRIEGNEIRSQSENVFDGVSDRRKTMCPLPKVLPENDTVRADANEVSSENSASKQTVPVATDTKGSRKGKIVSLKKEKPLPVSGIGNAATTGSRDSSQAEISPVRLNDLLRTMAGVIYTCRFGGNHAVTYMSDNVKIILGHDPQQFLGRPKFRMDKIHPEDIARIRAGISLMAEAGYYNYEYRFLHKDGSYRWIRDELRLICDEEGDPCEIVGCLFDVSDQKRTENDLREVLKSLKKLESIVNKSPAVVFLWRNAEGLPVDYVSDNVQQFGYTSDDFFKTKLSFADLIHPDDAKRVFTEISGCSPENQMECCETYRILNKSGEEHWVKGLHCARCDASGSVSHYEGIILDVTEQTRAEAQLKNAESRFKTLVEQVPAITYIMKARDFSTIYLSPQVERMLGVSQSEWQSDPSVWMSRLHPDDRQKVLDDMRAAVEQGSASVSEYRMVKSTDEVVWFRNASKPVFSDDCSEPLLQGVMLDVSDHKRAEEQIQNLNKRLEQRVRERTAELEVLNNAMKMQIEVRKETDKRIRNLNEKLGDRARALEEVNKELKAFSYSVSHDLRAPARMIMGFARALKEDYEGKLDTDGEYYLNCLESSAQRLEQLIDDMLKLSKVTTAELNIVGVDLSDLAESIMNQLRFAHPNRVVEFIFEPNLTARGDANLIRLALENLLQNAVKFTGKRAAARIEFGRTNNRDEPVYFVRDNGAGFDMEYSQKLFGVFQRLHAGEDFEGTGIGLATVRRIINRHGGRIWAEGVVDQGATFYFTLPAHMRPTRIK